MDLSLIHISKVLSNLLNNALKYARHTITIDLFQDEADFTVRIVSCLLYTSFTWLQPYEEKSWVQYFMPYSEVGYVKNATKDALLNLEIKEGKADRKSVV